MINTNPAVGPVRNGKQTIAVFDQKLGNFRTIETQPNKVEQFIEDRSIAKQETINNEKKSSAKIIGFSTIGAMGANLLIEYGKALTSNINSFKDLLNKLKGNSFKEIVKNTYKLISLKGVNLPKPTNLAKGTVFSGLLALGLATIVSSIKTAYKIGKTDAKITEDFINNNKA